MSTRYNTGNPIESTDVRDMSDNAKNFDEFSNSEASTFTDRLGVERLTIKGAIESTGFKPGSGDFTIGFTVLPGQYDIAWRNPPDNNWYSFLGVIPSPAGYPVAPGTNPVGSSSWKPVTDAFLREELAASDSNTVIAGITAKDLVSEATKQQIKYLDDYGAAGDGVTDDYPAFLLAKADLGVTKVCRLKQGLTYYFAGSRPDLSGLAIYSEFGSKIKTDANPNIKTMTLVNDVTINNTVHATTLVKHGNVSHDYLVSAGAAVNRLSAPTKIIKKLFGDADVTLASLSGVNTKGAFTGVNNSTHLSWGADFGANQQGAFAPFEEGVLFEAAFRHVGTASYDTRSFRSVSVICGSTQRVDFAIYPQQVIATLIVQGAGATSIDIPLPNGGAYSLAASGAITMGARVVNGVAEFYVNGTLFKKFTLASDATEIAFLTSYLMANRCQILHPTKTYSPLPNSSKQRKVAVVGDSISYAAWATESYDSIMSKALEHCGIGGVTSVNYAVSGSSTAGWIPGGSIDISTKALSDCEYTLIMLGTNDVQGGVTGTTFEANMRAIIANVISQGSRPVLGVFPVWTETSISGVTGATTQNYEKGGWHRQIVKMLAAEMSLPLADVCAKFGTNIQWYGDNIHPIEHGQIAVAAAFAEAILSDSNPRLYIPTPAAVASSSSVSLSLVNSWAAVAANQAPSARLNKFDSTVRLKGPITSGAVATTICTLPVGYRPSFKRSFIVPCNSSAPAYGFAQINVLTTGVVEIISASVTPLIVWLDSVIFDI